MNHLALNTENVSRGLFIQQLFQNVTASNLSKNYIDDEGYLISSRQRVETVEGFPLLFGGRLGVLAAGTGPLAQQITRYRSMFLDMQIQQQSIIVGKGEVMLDVLNRVNAIVNGSTGTLNAAMTNLAAAWSALAADPLDVAMRSTVVQDGVSFATLAHNQYQELQNYQVNLSTNIQQTVTDINNLLQQLSSFNKELRNSQGAKLNDLLDARDYALDRLSRLLNVQVSIGSNETVSVFLENSSLSLVDLAGAALLQADLLNPHNPGLSNVRLQSSEGTFYSDISKQITGGRLGGLLQARDVIVEGYKTQVDQIATSVMSVTNMLHRSGYAADGVTTNTNFFRGTGAVDIQVNASIVADTTHALLAASSRVGVINAATNGQIAQFIGNLPNLLANNFMESRPAVSGGVVDPTQAINTQPFITVPAAAGSFTVNGNAVNWTNANTIYDILNMINAADPNVEAVFNATERNFYIFSNDNINIVDTAGNFTRFGALNNVLVSSIRMNNGFAPTDPNIIYGFPFGANSALNSLPNLAVVPMQNRLGNTQAFRVTPGVEGSFTLNGVTFNWNNTQSLFQILNQIVTANAGGAFPGTQISPFFNTTTQTLTIFSTNSPRPIQLTDITGNFSVFTGLNADTQIGELSSGILAQISGDVSAQKLTQDQAQASLTQLNKAQADLAAIDTSESGGGWGEPIALEQQKAVNSLIAYNALLQVMQIIDQMYADLVDIVGGLTGGSIFGKKS
jgi:flagellar hook-associated protein FlgK